MLNFHQALFKKFLKVEPAVSTSESLQGLDETWQSYICVEKLK